MNRKLLSVFLVLVFLVGMTATALAGIEPSPWQPQINQLHSIELNLAAIQSRMQHLSDLYPGDTPFPPGTLNYLLATANQLSGLDARLGYVLNILPAFALLDPASKRAVFFALDGIRTNASGIEDLLEPILRRLGVDPVPWKAPLDSIQNRIIKYLGTGPVDQ